jgi:hypothetical protein
MASASGQSAPVDAKDDPLVLDVMARSWKAWGWGTILLMNDLHVGQRTLLSSGRERSEIPI